MKVQHLSRRSTATAFAFLLGCVFTPAANAQADRDLAEINRYRMTESGLAKYTQATRNLASVDLRGSGACEAADDDGPQSIDAAAAKLDAEPQASRALGAAGMTAREFVVFSFALMQSGLASWALEQPGGKLPPGASMENVEFFRKHKAALDALEKQDRQKSCDEDGADEDSGDADAAENAA